MGLSVEGVTVEVAAVGAAKVEFVVVKVVVEVVDDDIVVMPGEADGVEWCEGGEGDELWIGEDKGGTLGEVTRPGGIGGDSRMDLDGGAKKGDTSSSDGSMTCERGSQTPSQRPQVFSVLRLTAATTAATITSW
jgi:hypothetical protein